MNAKLVPIMLALACASHAPVDVRIVPNAFTPLGIGYVASDGVTASGIDEAFLSAREKLEPDYPTVSKINPKSITVDFRPSRFYAEYKSFEGHESGKGFVGGLTTSDGKHITVALKTEAGTWKEYLTWEFRNALLIQIGRYDLTF